MLNEIRGLKAHMYHSDEGDVILDIYQDDDGTHIVNVDLELDLLYHWVIDEHGQVVGQFVEEVEIKPEE